MSLLFKCFFALGSIHNSNLAEAINSLILS